MKRILHLSDPHFGAASEEIAAAFLAQANAAPPDLTILSGDLTMRASDDEMAAASAFVQQLPSPRIVIPGNHDMPGVGDLLERFFTPFRTYQASIQQDLEPELTQDGLHLVSLNSSRPWGFYTDWSQGRISSRQLTRMKNRFLSTNTPDFRVLVLHHPLVELQIPGRAVVRPLVPLLASMEEAKVDLVLCGHFHRSIILSSGLTGAWNSIISQAPTVCSIRLQGEPQGYHEIQVESDHAEIIHRVYDHGSFIVRSVTPFTRAAAGWTQTTRSL